MSKPTPETSAGAGTPSLPEGLTIERASLDALHLDPSNARLHGEENLAAIQASLERFGQAEPLVVQAETGRVIGGNGRLVAMQALGWTACDVVRLDVGDDEATALAIALNRTGELAEWDLQALLHLLDKLRADDTLDGIGFSVDDIDMLLAQLEAEEPEPRDIDDPGPGEPPADPVSCPGDLWLLGDHRLLCGDATRSEDLETLMGGETATLLATDPPYCVGYTGASRPVVDGKPSGKDWSAVYNEVSIADYEAFLGGVLPAVLARVQPAAAIYIWHAHVQQQLLAKALEEHGILFHQVIVWVKPTPVFGHSYFQWQHEPCAFGWRKGSKPRHGTSPMSTVWQVDWEGKQRVVGNDHPTQKPLRLFEIPMELHTKPGDVVLEPFVGSGSQILAAERRGRRCYALDISPAFVDVCVRRYEQATGRSAVLDGTGMSFADVARQRLGQPPSDRRTS